MKLQYYLDKEQKLKDKITAAQEKLASAKASKNDKASATAEKNLEKLKEELKELGTKIKEVKARPLSKCARIDQLLLKGKNHDEVLETIKSEFKITSKEAEASTSRTIRCRPWHLRKAGHEIPKREQKAKTKTKASAKDTAVAA